MEFIIPNLWTEGKTKKEKKDEILDKNNRLEK